MKTLLLVFIFSFFVNHSFDQSIFYQDIFNGGVCVTGTGSANTGNPYVDVPYHVETGSNIRKIFMITYELVINDGTEAYDYDFIINGVPIPQNNTTNQTVFAPNTIFYGWIGQRNHIVDVSDMVTLSGGMIHIEVPYHDTPSTCPGCYYSAPVFVILYENMTLPTVNIAMVINDVVNSANSQIAPITGFNPANTSFEIGLGVHSDRLGGIVAGGTDGFNYYMNGQFIGFNDTIDSIFGPNLEAGVIGTFYYQGNSFFGLTDDIPNNMLSGSDGIVLLNDYVNATLSPMNIEFNYIVDPGTNLHNILVGLYFAYTTPCEPFDVSVSADTTICQGETLQLNANGGQSYEWFPTTGLSCNTCPNPIFTADTTRLYSVKIFNNDSCSVIRPVMVYVKENPEINNILIQPTECGNNAGMVSILDPTGMQYSIDNSNFQQASQFFLVSEGNHLVQVMDSYGCVSDTLINVSTTVNTIANFSATPQNGAKPLSTIITNQSSNATVYEWSINGVPYLGNLSSYVFDTSGVYVIQLIAYNNLPYCSDTTWLSINVYDSLVITLPNVFTPNFDGTNDFFTLTANQNVTYELVILNRWGNVVFEENSNLVAGVTKNVWGGNTLNEVTDGVYFVKLRVVTENGEIKQIDNFTTIIK